MNINTLYPWQQQLLMLRDKGMDDREVVNIPFFPSQANTQTSLALLRSLAALSEKMPQVQKHHIVEFVYTCSCTSLITGLNVIVERNQRPRPR